MIALEQARQHLETLGLKQAVEVLDNTLDAAANKQLPYPEMLAELLGVEVAARRERYLTTRTRLAHLPFQRTLEQFDFARSFIRTRQHRADHDNACTSDNSFGNVTREADTTIGDNRNVTVFQCFNRIRNSGNLWYTTTGYDTGGTD